MSGSFAPIGATVFTVATIPLSSTLGQTIFVSDCLTSFGAGDFAYWNGSNWRTVRDQVTPTTILLNFYRSLVNTGRQIRSGEFVFFYNDYSAGSDLPNSNSFNSGTGAGGATPVNNSTTYSGVINSFTGSTATGVAGRTLAGGGGNVIPDTNNASSYYWSARILLPDGLSTVSEEYHVQIGFTGAGQSGAASTKGIEFIYDRLGTLGYGASDNWVVRRSSTTGGAFTQATSVAVAGTTWFLLEALGTSAGVDFYINGSNVATATRTFAEGNLGWRSVITKTAGTTSRNLYTDWDAIGFRLSTPVVRFTGV